MSAKRTLVSCQSKKRNAEDAPVARQTLSCCRFARDNCPSYLVEKNFNELKAGRLDGLNIFSGTFMDALKQRQYSKAGAAHRNFMHRPPLSSAVLIRQICMERLQATTQQLIQRSGLV